MKFCEGTRTYIICIAIYVLIGLLANGGVLAAKYQVRGCVVAAVSGSSSLVLTKRCSYMCAGNKGSYSNKSGADCWRYFIRKI